MDTKTLDLRGLDDAARNARVNEVMSLAFDGWREAPLGRGDKTNKVAARFVAETFTRPGAQSYTPTVLRFTNGTYGGELFKPYSTSADVVLSLLEKRMSEVAHMHREKIGWEWDVKVWKEDSSSYFPDEGEAPTFPLAACYALLRANGIKVLT